MSKNKYATYSHSADYDSADPVNVTEPETAAEAETASAVEATEPVVGDAASADETIILDNANRTSVIIRSVTGDTILLPVGSHSAPGHFNWNLPDGVTVVKG